MRFYNEKNTKRLQYKWHQESSYYQDIRIGFHLWFPLFGDIKKNQGPMIIAKGSHKFQFDYEIQKDENSLTQLKINEPIEEKFELIECTLNRGDAIISHHNLVHCTGINETEIPRISGIIRYLDSIYSGNFVPQVLPTDTSDNKELVKCL